MASTKLRWSCFLLFVWSFQSSHATCTPENLEALDLTTCFSEIRTMFVWDEDPDPFDCDPWNILFLHDSSNTVRRSSQYGANVDMETIQELYVQTFFDVLGPEVTENVLAYIAFATEPHDYIPLGSISDPDEFLDTALVWTDQGFYKNAFFTGSHRGWTDMSNALARIREILEFNTNRTLIIIMSDGHPENQGSPELAEAVAQARALKEEQSAHIHIHCFLMRFDAESQVFWRNTSLCDSKDFSTTTNGVQESYMLQVYQYWAERNEFCFTSDSPTSSPTSGPTTSPTAIPTSSPTSPLPTTSPTESPTGFPTFQPTVCDDAVFTSSFVDGDPNVTENNLCGVNGLLNGTSITYTNFIGDDFLGNFSNLSLTLDCNVSLSQTYASTNEDPDFVLAAAPIRISPGESVTYTGRVLDEVTGLEAPQLGIRVFIFDIDQDSAGRNEQVVVCGFSERITEIETIPISTNLIIQDDTPQNGCVTIISNISNVIDPPIGLSMDQLSVSAGFLFRFTSEYTITHIYDGPANSSISENIYFNIGFDTQDCDEEEVPNN